MQDDPDVDVAGLIGQVAALAGAVVAVVAAVPSLGTSLVALAPAMVALSSTVVDNLEPMAKQLLAGDKVQTDAIKKAYDKADKEAAAVVKGAKAIVNFVEVVQKLGAAHTTPDNSQHLALVRQGVQQTYELLLARHHVIAAQQRLDSTEARVTRAAETVARIDALKRDLTKSEEAVRTTALHAMAIAESKADALLTLAFYAQRSVEIYTLQDHEDKVRLETGHLSPDVSLAFQQGEITEVQLVDRLNDSWQGLLQLLDLQVAFNQFTAQFHEPDARRLSFGDGSPELAALRATHRFSFRVDPAALPPGQVDAKVRGVRLALVGATNPTSEITCQIRARKLVRNAPEGRLGHGDRPPGPGQQPLHQGGQPAAGRRGDRVGSAAYRSPVHRLLGTRGRRRVGVLDPGPSVRGGSRPRRAHRGPGVDRLPVPTLIRRARLPYLPMSVWVSGRAVPDV